MAEVTEEEEVPTEEVGTVEEAEEAVGMDLLLLEPMEVVEEGEVMDLTVAAVGDPTAEEEVEEDSQIPI